MQRLTVLEKKAIQNWLLDLASWNWPLWIKRLCAIATKLLVAKGNITDLGVYQCGASDTQNPGITQVPTWIFLGRYLPE